MDLKVGGGEGEAPRGDGAMQVLLLWSDSLSFKRSLKPSNFSLV